MSTGAPPPSQHLHCRAAALTPIHRAADAAAGEPGEAAPAPVKFKKAKRRTSNTRKRPRERHSVRARVPPAVPTALTHRIALQDDEEDATLLAEVTAERKRANKGAVRGRPPLRLAPHLINSLRASGASQGLDVTYTGADRRVVENGCSGAGRRWSDRDARDGDRARPVRAACHSAPDQRHGTQPSRAALGRDATAIRIRALEAAAERGDEAGDKVRRAAGGGRWRPLTPLPRAASFASCQVYRGMAAYRSFTRQDKDQVVSRNKVTGCVRACVRARARACAGRL